MGFMKHYPCSDLLRWLLTRLQGQGFEPGMQCTLVDGVNDYNVTTNATVISSNEVGCALPAWQSPTGNDSAVLALYITWADGCVLQEVFGVYPAPAVASLGTQMLPRYGSWPLLLQLRSPLMGLPLSTVRTESTNICDIFILSGCLDIVDHHWSYLALNILVI